ncbi:hypothetical protein Tco_0478006 [Tanacetum coccineum]
MGFLPFKTIMFKIKEIIRIVILQPNPRRVFHIKLQLTKPPVHPRSKFYRTRLFNLCFSSPAFITSRFQNQGVSKEDFHSYVKANDAVMRNMQTQGQNMQNQLTTLTEMLSKFVASNTASTSGTLPGNTVTNPKEDLKGSFGFSDVIASGNPLVLRFQSSLLLLNLNLPFGYSDFLLLKEARTLSLL